MAANALIKRLASVYRGEKIRHPRLRDVTLAQWLLESGRGTSALAVQHYNFGGLKWRPEMAGYATRIKYKAADGTVQEIPFNEGQRIEKLTVTFGWRHVPDTDSDD